MQVLFDAGFVSICLAHGRRMGMLRYEKKYNSLYGMKIKYTYYIYIFKL